MTDEELRDGLARDLDAAFEKTVLAYQDRLYAFALRYSGNPQEAEEIVQDAFIRAYHALAAYAPDRRRALSLRAWLFQITVNLARNHARGRHAEQPLGAAADNGAYREPASGAREQPDSQYEQRERRHDLAVLLRALPPRYRTAVILRYVNDLDYGEIAALLEQPVGTVKSHVHRGLRLLREAMADGEEYERVEVMRA